MYDYFVWCGHIIIDIAIAGSSVFMVENYDIMRGVDRF
jgi:hypothetical protein